MEEKKSSLVPEFFFLPPAGAHELRCGQCADAPPPHQYVLSCLLSAPEVCGALWPCGAVARYATCCRHLWAFQVFSGRCWTGARLGSPAGALPLRRLLGRNRATFSGFQLPLAGHR